MKSIYNSTNLSYNSKFAHKIIYPIFVFLLNDLSYLMALDHFALVRTIFSIALVPHVFLHIFKLIIQLFVWVSIQQFRNSMIITIPIIMDLQQLYVHSFMPFFMPIEFIS